MLLATLWMIGIFKVCLWLAMFVVIWLTLWPFVCEKPTSRASRASVDFLVRQLVRVGPKECASCRRSSADGKRSHANSPFGHGNRSRTTSS